MASSSAHSTLAKRLLFPVNSSKDLPSLLLSTPAASELDAELYDFIALALRAFVNPWWSKITRYDKEFLPEITQILTHVIRSFEARLLAADLAPLVFHDIPTLLTLHYRDYRNAQAKLSTSYAAGGATSLPQLFHNMQPHMAISADGKINQEYFRQVLDIVLRLALPPEEYGPEAERFIVREVILKVVLEDVIPKVTQPWFIQKTILDLLGQDHETLKSHPSPAPSTPATFSFHNLLVIVLSFIQSVSGACLALINTYKQTVNTIKRVSQSAPSSPVQRDSTLEAAGSVPPNDPALNSSPPIVLSNSTSSMTSTSSGPPSDTLIDVTNSRHSNHANPPIHMLAEVFTLNNRFASTTLLTFALIIAASASTFLDRLLPRALSDILSLRFILDITRTAKHTLFPNGYPGPAPPEPSAEEQAELRARLVAWRPRGALGHAFPFILGPDPSEALGLALDPLTSQPCNVHLIVLVLDRVLAVLFPELLGSA